MPNSVLEYERPWLYPKQAAALFAAQRYSFVEASTKSGKTVGCIAWLFEQAALGGKPGRNYWWVAPTLPVAKIAFRRMKRAIPRHLYKSNDTEVTLTLANGAVIWFKGADRPDTLYGEDVYGAVIDEGSRCKEDAWVAVRTTLTATQGPVRVIGNVKGKQNWFYRLARKAEVGDLARSHYAKLTADDAADAGIFPSQEAAEARSMMPESAWKELYYAEAADDGSNPFGLEAIAACTMTDAEWLLAQTGETIARGWDFARATDWTVGVGLGRKYEVTRFDRWQLKPWSETYAEVKRLSGPVPAWGDSTAMGGDIVVETLQRMGVPIQGYVFSRPSKQLLMQRLASTIQQRKVRFPAGVIVSELESFGYEYSVGGGVRYSAPEGLHDDCVMALALAVYGRDQFGELPELQAKKVRAQDDHPGLREDGKRNPPRRGLPGRNPDQRPSFVPGRGPLVEVP